jgi:hypothetical protein
MKDGTAYGGRVKKAFKQLRRAAEQLDIADIAETDDPLHRLAVAILGVGSTDDEAVRAVDRALGMAADWNELRVSTAQQLQNMFGRGPARNVDGCRRLIAALQNVYHNENAMSLERLRTLGRREAKQYLESLDGVDEYAVASVVLWSLGGHAIPVNDRLLEALRDAALVHPQADRGEVQAFLERHVAATDAREFCILARYLGGTKKSSSKKTSATTASRTKKKQRRAC